MTLNTALLRVEKIVEDMKRQQVRLIGIKEGTTSEMRKINHIANKFLEQQRRLFKVQGLQVKTLKDRCSKIDAKIVELRKIQIFFEEIKRAHEALEDTVLNILLAIRQNEYLQAWYPAQQGHPAQKVVGSHPIKIKERQRNGTNSQS